VNITGRSLDSVSASSVGKLLGSNAAEITIGLAGE